MTYRTFSDVTPTLIVLKTTADHPKNPNPPLAQSKLHRFAISGLPARERVHTKVYSMRDLRRRIQAGFACPAPTNDLGTSL